MSETEERVDSVPGIEAGDRPLTNKEKRQLAVAQKRQAKEQAASKKVSATGEKRKRDAEPTQSNVEDAVEGEDGEEVEAEVLSHKEQRRRKKLAKLEPSLEEASSARDGGDVKGIGRMHPSRAAVAAPALQPRTGYSIWVGNLSFFTAPAKLIDWFNTRGVDGISRVHMPKGMRRAEMNRGFCYLDLPSKDMLTAALNLSEQPLDGRKLLIKDGSDFTGRPDINTSALGIARNIPAATQSLHANRDDDDDTTVAEEDGAQAETMPNLDGEKVVKGKTGLTKTAQKILRAQKNPPSMTLFLGNLSFNTTEQGVRDLFDHSASKRNPTAKQKRRLKERKPQPKRKTTSTSSSSSSDDSDSDSGSDSDSDSDSDSSSDSSESGSEEEEQDKSSSSKQEEGEKKERSHSDVVASAAGIRKVRLGTFEDAPTKCKGFGFLDFHTVEQATASLIDPRNAFLDGRRIVLQYASADATRRGASKAQKSTQPRVANPLKVGFQRNKPKRNVHQQEQEQGKSKAQAEEPDKLAPLPGSWDPNAPLPKKHKETKEERFARRAALPKGKGSPTATTRRAKPGAALANAQRASSGIVQSTGTKLTFDD